MKDVLSKAQYRFLRAREVLSTPDKTPFHNLERAYLQHLVVLEPQYDLPEALRTDYEVLVRRIEKLIASDAHSETSLEIPELVDLLTDFSLRLREDTWASKKSSGDIAPEDDRTLAGWSARVCPSLPDVPPAHRTSGGARDETQAGAPQSGAKLGKTQLRAAGEAI